MTEPTPEMAAPSSAPARAPARSGAAGAVPAAWQREPERILVGLLCPIGDTLLATPALAALHARFPEAAITALVYRGNAGILAGNPAVARCEVLDAGAGGARLVRIARGASRLEWSAFDLVVNFSPAASLLGTLAGGREPARQVHMRMPRHWWLLGGNSPSYDRRHAVDHYLDLVRPLLRGPVPEEERVPRVYLSEAERAGARRLLAERGVPEGGRLIVLHAGGEGFDGRKQWSATRFAAVGRHMVRAYDAWVALVGGKEDGPLSEGIARLIGPRAVSVAGASSLLESAGVIEAADLFIGNDSCPLHIAAAVKTPAVGIFGPSNVDQFRPVGGPGYRCRVLHGGLPCAPCFQFVGSDAPWVPNLCYTRDCLKAVTVSQVVQAAHELLGGHEPARADGRWARAATSAGD